MLGAVVLSLACAAALVASGRSATGATRRDDTTMS
jgi:hypothetical protein